MATVLGVGPGVFILCMLWTATTIVCLLISYRETRSNIPVGDNFCGFTYHPKRRKSRDKRRKI
uniref:Hypotheticial protein n=1 Tax=Schistosoma japonicum TaxID=6182 RepID=C1LES5_SCHJA|nr:hypotheticial protein [Schistosoma japonicum]